MRTVSEVDQVIDVNPEWGSILYLFKNHRKLQHYLVTDYFDLDNGFIGVKQLVKLSKPWSKSERFMLHLAIHLFNGEVKVDLNDIDYLDSTNKQLVKEALKIRFKM